MYGCLKCFIYFLFAEWHYWQWHYLLLDNIDLDRSGGGKAGHWPAVGQYGLIIKIAYRTLIKYLNRQHLNQRVNQHLIRNSRLKCAQPHYTNPNRTNKVEFPINGNRIV